VKNRRNSHCSYCGHPFVADQPWPRLCASCGVTSFVNPIPVAVCLLPVDGGLLCMRRAIPPGQGKLALPGGYIDLNETWQQAAARELFEETGIIIDPAEIEHFRTHSSMLGDGVLLIFGRAQPRTWASLPPFVPTNESSETVRITGPLELAFPLHTQVVREYFTANPGAAS
jgi:8-oxo-dGTP pyrophosphatase MutT (NUDIX family)